MTPLKQTATAFSASHSIPTLPTFGNEKKPKARWNVLDTDPGAWQNYWEQANNETGIWLYCNALPKCFYVLDVDVPKEFIPTALEFMGINEPGVRVNTPSGGCHFYIQSPRPLNLRTTTSIPSELIGGASGAVEVRQGGSKQGLLMPGSQARAKDNEVRSYMSKTEAEIWSMDWAIISHEEADSLENVLGAPASSKEQAAEIERSAVSALTEGNIRPVLNLYQGGVEQANEWCTTYGKLFGRLVRSGRVPGSQVAEEVWAQILENASPRMRSDLENRDRHKASFVVNFTEAVHRQQAAFQRLIAKELRIERSESVDKDEKTLEIESASFKLFGGGVRVFKKPQPGARAEWSLAVLHGEYMVDRGARLSDADLEHYAIRREVLESGFASVAGVSFVAGAALLFDIPRARLTEFKASNIKAQDFADWLVAGGTIDNSTVDFAEFRLPDLIQRFHKKEYEAGKRELKDYQQSRHAWFLAPRPGGNKVGPEPFLVVEDGHTCLALTPVCRKRMDSSEIRSITKGSEPHYTQSTGTAGQEVHLYLIDEILEGEEGSC